MSEHHPLQYWLESINLPQYYLNFSQHGLITRDQCLALDEQTLADIGITMSGHQRRILTHLPTQDNGIWTQDEARPNLPPKKKSFRQSFLYKDGAPNATNTGATNDNASSPSKGADGLNVPDKASTDGVKLSPKPVPRPRSQKPKSSTSSVGEDRPRPVPRQRKQASPSPSDVNLGSSPNLQNTNQPCDKLDSNTEETVPTSDHTPALDFVYSEDQKSVAISPHEKLSIGEDVLADNTVYKDTNSGSKDLTRGFSISLEGACLEESEDTGEATQDDIYVNLADKSITDSLPDADNDAVFEDRKINFASENSSVRQSSNYVNLDYLKKCESAHSKQSDTGGAIAASGALSEPNYSQSQNSARFNPDILSDVTDSPSPDHIYEPIWAGLKKDKKDNLKEQNKSSNLMDFSPLKVGVKSQGIGSNRLSTFGTNTSFDLPPPGFDPPPLPAQSRLNADSILDDFDPLSTSTHVPPIPPRPDGYVPPRLFQTYENLPFHDSGGSSTMPGTDKNMEPDTLCTPQPLMSIGDMASANSAANTMDPFKKVDPFGEFTPDDSGTEMFPPSSHTAEGRESTFVNAVPCSTFDTSQNNSSAIYDNAGAAPEQDFDPFGLNRKESSSSLARSVSTSSGGSVYKLTDVPPPPKWPHNVPEGSWFQSSSNDSMYSLAEQLHDEDASSCDSLDDILGSPATSQPEQSANMSPVDILPPTASRSRKKERSGYLFKQGGVKNNRGWKKRWVIFDGKTLRYYLNNRDQVSKRIVPLSCMKNVEMDIKLKDIVNLATACDYPLRLVHPNNSRQFKFLLHCTNRTFLFATDDLDDCKLWSHTLMEAILTQPVVDKEVEGGDMANPDMAAWIKLDRNRVKFYFVLKKHKLCYYQNIDDYKMASPLNEVEMQLAGISEVDRTKLKLLTHYSTFFLHFETSSDASNWKLGIEEAITDAHGDNSILDQVRDNPANTKCADCSSPNAHWASMNLVMVLCLRCAGVHRGFDLKLSKVRSLRMDTRIWNSSLIELFKVIGNEKANQFWLKLLPQGSGIKHDTPAAERVQFIHNKYKDKLYCDKHPYTGDRIRLNEALISAAQTDDVLITYQTLKSGAEVLYCRRDQPDTTAFDMAKQAHQRLQMEFLLQNGGDRSRCFLPGSDEEASLTAKMRSDVQLNGFLSKTGSSMRDFKKRYCVLEHGNLSYYNTKASKVEKDRIDNEDILYIQAVHHDRQPACFEISTKRNNRVYLFTATSDEERMQWMNSLAQVTCPVKIMELMKTKQFTLAGYAHLKTGFNMEWQRSWFVLENRTLLFTDKEEVEREYDSIDLRKVSNITKIKQSMDSCQASLEQGYVFSVKIGDRMLYLQADLVRDTDRLFTAIEQVAKRGGDTLEDQQLTNDDIPVIVVTCVNFVQDNGLTIEGIYRKSGVETLISGLLQKFHEDARSVMLTDPIEDQVHVACNTVKRFFRNLKEPLFTKQFYSRWIRTAGEADHNSKLQWYKYLLQQLPRINYLTLKFFVMHLHKMCEQSNQMSVDSMAICLGSSLMQVKDDMSVHSVNTDTQLQQRVLADIIQYHDWLFEIDYNSRAKQLAEAQHKLSILLKEQTTCPTNEMMIHVFYLSTVGHAQSITITQETTAADVISRLSCTDTLPDGTSWALHEIVKTKLERPLHGDTNVWSVFEEWQNWPEDYRTTVNFCVKHSDLKDKIYRAYDPAKALFSELKYSDKKKFSKMCFEFTRSKLSYFKDAKSLSHPLSSWNVEDLNIYKGCDPKRSPPTEHSFTFLAKGDKIGEKELFGRTVCCSSDSELFSWLGAMYKAQQSAGS